MVIVAILVSCTLLILFISAIIMNKKLWYREIKDIKRSRDRILRFKSLRYGDKVKFDIDSTVCTVIDNNPLTYTLTISLDSHTRKIGYCHPLLKLYYEE